MNKLPTSFIISGIIFFAIVTLLLLNPLQAFAAIVCSGGSCSYVACTTNSDCGTNTFSSGAYSCQSNNLYQDYITYTCNNAGTANASCTSGKEAKQIQTCTNNQKCQIGLWYTGCVSPTNTNNNTNTSNANNSYQSNSYQRCVNNAVYWFDSNGSQQSLYQTCANNQTCSNNSCIVAASLSCASHAIKGCINNAVYWYNSCGTQQEVYQNCSATNQTCQNGACAGTQTYYNPQPTLKPVLKIPAPKSKDIIITIFGKNEPTPLQWEKDFNVFNKDTIDFLITVKNISNSPIDNVLVTANMTSNIEYTDNLKINGVGSNDNILSGVNLGTVLANTSKAISFTGSAEAKDPQHGVKITGTVNSNTVSDSDFFVVNIDVAKTNQNAQIPQVTPEQPTATASVSSGNSFVNNFLKRWYLWVFVLAILGTLFVVIFKKLSKEV